MEDEGKTLQARHKACRRLLASAKRGSPTAKELEKVKRETEERLSELGLSPFAHLAARGLRNGS